MGEYVMTTVTVGGPLLDPQAVEALIEAASEYFADADALARAALAEGRSFSFEDLQDCSRTPGLDAFCRAQGLSYHGAWVPQVGQFEAGLEYWRPGLAEPVEEAADEAGEPMFTLAALRRCVDGGQTLETVLARLDASVSGPRGRRNWPACPSTRSAPCTWSPACCCRSGTACPASTCGCSGS